MMPKWEIIKLSDTRFQINELVNGKWVFVGIRTSEAEATESINKMRREYEFRREYATY